MEQFFDENGKLLPDFIEVSRWTAFSRGFQSFLDWSALVASMIFALCLAFLKCIYNFILDAKADLIMEEIPPYGPSPPPTLPSYSPVPRTSTPPFEPSDTSIPRCTSNDTESTKETSDVESIKELAHIGLPGKDEVDVEIKSQIAPGQETNVQPPSSFQYDSSDEGTHDLLDLKTSEVQRDQSSGQSEANQTDASSKEFCQKSEVSDETKTVTEDSTVEIKIPENEELLASVAETQVCCIEEKSDSKVDSEPDLFSHSEETKLLDSEKSFSPAPGAQTVSDTQATVSDADLDTDRKCDIVETSTDKEECLEPATKDEEAKTSVDVEDLIQKDKPVKKADIAKASTERSLRSKTSTHPDTRKSEVSKSAGSKTTGSPRSKQVTKQATGKTSSPRSNVKPKTESGKSEESPRTAKAKYAVGKTEDSSRSISKTKQVGKTEESLKTSRKSSGSGNIEESSKTPSKTSGKTEEPSKVSKDKQRLSYQKK